MKLGDIPACNILNRAKRVRLAQDIYEQSSRCQELNELISLKNKDRYEMNVYFLKQMASNLLIDVKGNWDEEGIIPRLSFMLNSTELSLRKFKELSKKRSSCYIQYYDELVSKLEAIRCLILKVTDTYIGEK